MHNTLFGKSEMYFLCMLRPLSFNIVKQDLEIEAAQVMNEVHGHFLYSFYLEMNG